jgi:hypothetical protein
VGRAEAEAEIVESLRRERERLAAADPSNDVTQAH